MFFFFFFSYRLWVMGCSKVDQQQQQKKKKKKKKKLKMEIKNTKNLDLESRRQWLPHNKKKNKMNKSESTKLREENTKFLMLHGFCMDDDVIKRILGSRCKPFLSLSVFFSPLPLLASPPPLT